GDRSGNQNDDEDDDREPWSVDKDGGNHRGGAPSSTRGRWRQLRRYGHPRADALLPLNHDALVRFQSFVDDREALSAGAEAQPALLDLVILANHKDVRPGLIDRDGGFWDHQDLVAALLLDDDANRLAAGENIVGIGEHRADRLTVGSRVNLDIEKIYLPPLAIERAVGQSDTGPQLPGHLGVAGFQHLALRYRKEHLHRVVFNHCREHTRIRTNQIAGRNGSASD